MVFPHPGGPEINQVVLMVSSIHARGERQPCSWESFSFCWLGWLPVHFDAQNVTEVMVKVRAADSRVDVSQPSALVRARASEIVGSESTGPVGDEELLASHGGAVHSCDQIVSGVPDPELVVAIVIEPLVLAMP